MEKLLKEILFEVTNLKSDISDLKQGQARLEEDISGLKQGQEKLEQDINEFKIGLHRIDKDQLKIENNNIINTIDEHKVKMMEYIDIRTEVLNKRLFNLEVQVDKLIRKTK